MTSTSSGISNQPNIKSLSTHEPSTAPLTKNDATAPAGGAAPAGGPDPQLVSWYEQAYSYYNSVMAGDPSTPKPDAASWNSFMEQMQWASQQLGYSAPTGQGALPPMANGQMPPQTGQQSNQFGGTSGTMDNWVYTNEKAEIGFTGDGTHDIWSNDVTIDVAPTSAKVTVENTTDTRFQPNESVVKITVTDPATGTQATYFVHDYDPSKDKIKINTPDSTSQVTNNTGDTTSITTGHFTQSGTGNTSSKPDASIQGEVQDDGSIVYEPDYAGGTIDFFANPGASPTDNQISVVYSDCNISVKPSDNVNVTKGTDGVLTVTVTHRDGSKDTYEVQKGYKANVNVNAEYITYGNPPTSSDTVPSDYSDSLTVNGGTTTGGSTSTDTAGPDAIVSALEQATGWSDAQLLNALKGATYTYTDLAAFKKDIQDGKWPPKPPDDNLLRLLDMDPTLHTALQAAATTRDANTGDKMYDKTKSQLDAVFSRLGELLTAIYPNDIVNVSSSSKASSNWWVGSATISINGTNTEIEFPIIDAYLMTKP